MRYVLIALLAWTTSLCHAQVILQPEGLEPGDQYRLIFTTSAKRDATSSNIEDYNNFVQSVADSSPEVASWGLEWKAIASTPTVDAVTNTETDWRVDDGVPIYRVDGALAYVDNDDLWVGEPFDSAHLVPLEIDEFGDVVPGDIPGEVGLVAVFTGTNGAGLRAPIDIPVELRGLGGTAFGTIGFANGNGPSTRFGTDSAPSGSENHFYAISDTVVAVPEPTPHPTALATIIGTISCLTRRRRRGRVEATGFAQSHDKSAERTTTCDTCS